MAARTGFQPTTLRTKDVESTNEPPRPTFTGNALCDGLPVELTFIASLAVTLAEVVLSKRPASGRCSVSRGHRVQGCSFDLSKVLNSCGLPNHWSLFCSIKHNKGKDRHHNDDVGGDEDYDDDDHLSNGAGDERTVVKL